MDLSNKELSTLAQKLKPYFRRMFDEYQGGYIGEDGETIKLHQQVGSHGHNCIQGTCFPAGDAGDFGRSGYGIDLQKAADATHFNEGGSSAILAGRLNYIDPSDDSIAVGGIGAKTWADYDTGLVMGNRISEDGDCQTMSIIKTGSGTFGFSSWGTLRGMDIETGQLWQFTSWLCLMKIGLASKCVYRIDGLIQNNAGTVTLPYSNVTVIYESDAAWDVRAQADNVGNELEWALYGTSGAGEYVRVTIHTQYALVK